MSVSSKILVDPVNLADLEQDLDDFVFTWGENPFLLSAFLRTSLETIRSANSFPAVLIVKVAGKVVGLASLSIHRFMGISYANSMLGWWATNDIILSKDHAQTATDTIFRAIFERLGCKFAMTYLPYPCPYLQNLIQAHKSQKKHLVLDSQPSISHAVIHVDQSWNDFLKFRGRYFQKDLRAVERKLNQAGQWRFSLWQNTLKSYNKKLVFEKIMTVEKQSWKEVFRGKQNEMADSQLKWILDSSNNLGHNVPKLNLKIWFLELNDQPIAFTLIFDFKRTAFIVKTSFAEKFRKMSPGFFVNNAAIQDIFNKREVENIDFLSSNSLVKDWDPCILPRMRLTVGDLSGIALVRSRMAVKRIVDKLENFDQMWPYSATARKQMKRIEKPLDFRRLLAEVR